MLQKTGLQLGHRYYSSGLDLRNVTPLYVNQSTSNIDNGSAYFALYYYSALSKQSTKLPDSDTNLNYPGGYIET